MLLKHLRRAADIWQRHVVKRLRRASGRRCAYAQLLVLEKLEDRTLPAAIVDAFNFAGAGGSQLAQNPDSVAANITASPVTRGTGLTAASTGNGLSSIPAGTSYAATLSSATALNQYYQFSVTPQSGYSLSLSGLSFNAYAQNGDSTLVGALQYSLDGGNTFSSVSLSGSLGGATPSSPKQASASLASIAALQNDTLTVLFRVYLFGAANGESTGIGQTSSDNDLQVTGVVAPQLPTASGVTADNVGGGWTGGGIVGQYYDNTTFAGAPSFTRTDDRIDFASNSQAPGGSSAPGYSAVAATNFSVLWTGSLITAYSQTYTFDGFAADTFNLEISPAGQNNWTTVVNQTAFTGQDFTGTYTFTAGATYNVKIQFVEYTGNWAAQLHWNSPSTPDQVINPISDSGINAITYEDTTYADALKMGANQWTSYTNANVAVTTANGGPTADATNIVWEGANGPDMAGTYLLQFNGLANVSINFGFATFTVNGQTYASLPSGVGYNSTTNTTTALVNVSNTATILYLNFVNTQLTQASPTDTGVTNVHLMRPTSPGATTYYPVGTLFDANLEAEYANFTTERWLTANFDTNQVNWSDRILPANIEAYNSIPNNGNADEVWEYEVELANETGKDLYITIPINATAQYVTYLAELIKYGSDGVNPYTTYQNNPIYPGLNLNLKVYIEWSNETWNSSFSQYGAANADAQQAVSDFTSGKTTAADYSQGAILDYNGQGASADFRLWTALMTVQASTIFRSVWGNAAIGDQVRVVLEYQYDNDSDTASDELDFIQDYFDNGVLNSSGQPNVSNPEPVSYYIWGSGGAVYYSSADPLGTQTAITIPNASFETPAVAANTAVVDPAGSSWTFTGNAGIYNGSAAIGSGSYSYTAPAPADGSQAVFIGGPAGNLAEGSISTTIDFTQTGTFAIQLDGANASEANSIRLFINGQEITPDYYENDPNYTNPLDDAWTPGFNIFGITDTAYYSYGVLNSYGTLPFTISTTGNYTLTIEGTGALGSYTYLDALQVTSLASIFAAGIPANGQANGEPAGLATYQAELNAQAVYAQTFGLHVVAYEGGWSLGGDNGGTPLQNYAKYVSSQATQANIASYDDFIQSGGALYIYGTYEQWPASDTTIANSFPLLQGVDATNLVLPPAVSNGIPASALLTSTDATFAIASNGSSLSVTTTMSPGGYFSWNVLVPAYGNYVITETTGSGGNALLLLDDDTTVASGASGGTLSGTVTLTQGLHTILVEATSGSFTFTQCTISAAHAPAAPTLTVAEGNAAATLTWNSVAGATGYRVRYGTSSEDYTTSILVGNVLTFTVPALFNGQIYYFTVDAYNANGDGPVSNEIAVTPLAATTVASLASWTFTGYVGNENSAPVTSVSSQVTATPLVRGPGLLNNGNTGLSANTFASGPTSSVNYAYAQSLSASISENQYYQFTVAPLAGDTLSLQALYFSPWFQNVAGAAGITYSTDGVNFSGGIVASGTASGSPSPFSVNLGSLPALQDTTDTITFRIYLYGVGQYDTSGLGSIGVYAMSATLASWNFNGYVGDETSAPVTSATSHVTLTSLVRGSGLLNDGNTALTANTFGSGPFNNNYAASLSGSIYANQYYQFTITPATGYTLSLQLLDFSPYFQTAAGGAGITWSTDGVDFTTGTYAQGTPSSSPSPFTVDLSGQAALQATTNTITFRIYLYGLGSYMTSGLGSIGVIGSFATPAAIGTTTAVTSVSVLTATSATPITFTATVTAVSGSVPPNSGEVEFFSGTTFLAAAAASTPSSTSPTSAIFTASSTLPAGTYNSIQAFYIPSTAAWVISGSSAFGSSLTVNTLPVFSGATSTSIYGGLGSAQVQTFRGVAATGYPTFSLTNSPPAWVTINSSTGVLNFGQNVTVPNYSTSTSVTITIQAAIAAGSVTETFTIIVTPTISYAATGTSSQQLFGSLPIATYTPSGPASSAGGPDDLTASFPAGFGSNDGLSGWYGTNLSSGATTELLAEGEPSGTTSALFDFNNGTAGSQALGILANSATDSSFGEILVNNTGQTVTSFSLSYTGEEWWRGTAGGSQSLEFGYQIGGTTLSAATGTYVASLGFTSPDTTAGGGTALNGTLSANNVAVNGTVSGITWAAGQTLILYWDKVNGASSNGDGLGIANVTFKTSAGSTSSPFTVNAVTPTPSGVVLTFSEPINPQTTVLYSSPGDTTLGSADVTVVSATAGPIRGSLIIDPTNPDIATFVQTTGLLAAGVYTVAVTPAVTSTSGFPLSATWSSTFTVTAATRPVLSIPSFARGPGQSVVLTDSLGNATGIPISISNASGVTQISFTLTYDPTLLTIASSGALTLSAALTEHRTNLTYTITSEDSHHDVLTANLSGAGGLTTSTVDPLLTITASVPTTAPYLNKALLNLGNVVVNDSNALGVSGVDENAYLGNVSGSGTISALDASLVDQVGAGAGTGFSAFKDLDPAIIGSINGGTSVGAVDASLINQAGSGASIPQIPAEPTGITLTTGGPDPYLYLSALQAPAGSTVTETLYLDVTDPHGVELTALDEAIAFDPAVLQVSNIRGASGLATSGSYATIGTVDNSAGLLLVGQAFEGSGLPPTIPFGTIVPVMQFDVTLNNEMAVGSVTAITLLQDGTLNGQTKYTAISDNEGALTWTLGMAPSNSGNVAVDGAVTVVASVPPVTESVASIKPVPTVPPRIVPAVKKVIAAPRLKANPAPHLTVVAATASPLTDDTVSATIVTASAPTLVKPTAAPAISAKVLEPTVRLVTATQKSAPAALTNVIQAIESTPSVSAEGSTALVSTPQSTAALDEVYAFFPTLIVRNANWPDEPAGSKGPSDKDSLSWLVEVALIDEDQTRKAIYLSNRR